MKIRSSTQRFLRIGGCRAVADGACNRRYEEVVGDRLLKIGAHAEFIGAIADRSVSSAGEQDDRKGQRYPVWGSEKIETRRARQVLIEKQALAAARPESAHELRCRATFLHFDVVGFQEHLEGIAHGLVIVDDEHFDACSRHSPTSEHRRKINLREAW